MSSIPDREPAQHSFCAILLASVPAWQSQLSALSLQIFILTFDVHSVMWTSQTAFAWNLNSNPWFTGEFAQHDCLGKKITCLEFDLFAVFCHHSSKDDLVV